MNHGIKIQFNEINNIEYTKWMKSILRRSEEVGKMELPITAFIIDEKGRYSIFLGLQTTYTFTLYVRHATWPNFVCELLEALIN